MKKDKNLDFEFFPYPDGEPIKLPESLESLPKSDHFPTQRHRWNTNEVPKGAWVEILGSSQNLKINFGTFKPTQPTILKYY